MATNDALKNQLDEKSTQVVDPSKLGFKALMNTPAMKEIYGHSSREVGFIYGVAYDPSGWR